MITSDLIYSQFITIQLNYPFIFDNIYLDDALKTVKRFYNCIFTFKKISELI